jgi:peptidoglycan/LPS O-acetylase OafA/YrhL
LAARTQSSSGAGFAVALGVVGVLAIPAAVAYSRESSTFSLLDAAWLIPLALVASIAALLIVRRSTGHVRFEPLRSVRAARILAVAGIALALAATIAVGFYELLLRLES